MNHYSSQYVFTNLHEHSRSQVFIPIPPVAGTAGATTGTEDTLVQTILLEWDF